MGRSDGNSSFFGWLLRSVFFGGLILLLVVAAFGLIARGILVHNADRAWAEATAELDGTDPDWRWDALEAKRAKVPDEQNSALVIARMNDEKMLTGLTSIKSRVDAEPRAQWDAAEPGPEWATAERLPMPDQFDERSAIDRVGHLPPEVRPDPALARAMTRDLARYRPAVEQAMRLAEMPTGRHPLTLSPDFIGTMLTTRQTAREVGVLLSLESARRAEGGDMAGALKAVRACLNAGRSIGDEPFLISMLVRMALDTLSVARLERVLAQGVLTEPKLAEFQKALEDEAAVPRMLLALRGERAGMMMLCQVIIDGKTGVSKVVGPGGGTMNSLADEAGALLARKARPEMLRFYTDIIDIAQGPTELWEEQMKPVEDRIKDGEIVTRLLTPAVTKVSLEELRVLAVLRTGIVSVAAERYRLKQGRWPATPTDLVRARLLDDVPADPYVGGPLRLTRKPYGLAAYSVGPDRKDDGGQRNGKTPFEPPGDIVFRLYDPKCRRATPETLPEPRQVGDRPGAFGLQPDGRRER